MHVPWMQSLELLRLYSSRCVKSSRWSFSSFCFALWLGLEQNHGNIATLNFQCWSILTLYFLQAVFKQIFFPNCFSFQIFICISHATIALHCKSSRVSPTSSTILSTLQYQHISTTLQSLNMEGNLNLHASYTIEPSSPPPCQSAVELQMSSASTASTLETLVANVSYLESNTGAVAQKFFKLSGLYTAGVPVVPLLGHVQGSVGVDPLALRDLLRPNLPPADRIYVYPPNKNPEDTERLTTDLVDHLGENDMQYPGITSSIMFECSLQHALGMPHLSPEFDPDIFPQATMKTMSIMPCGATLPLECSSLVNFSEVHLLTGVRVYLVWPPTSNNVASMHSCFNTVSDAQQAQILERLEDGVTFVQRVGEVVTLPPFCPTLVFATQTSAAMVFSFRDVKTLPQRLRYIGLLPEQIQALHGFGTPRSIKNIEYYLAQFYKDMGELLLGTAANSTSTTQLRTLVAFSTEWSHARVQFRELIEQHTSGNLRRHILENMPRLWGNAMMHNDTYGTLKACPICQADNQQYYLSDLFWHFDQLHWSLLPLVPYPALDQTSVSLWNPEGAGIV